uniref:CCT domain-containing protein n=1 Tax=Opuntia streptacantha TaxID=393608 RepID=A0A7C8ZXU4_OPUST
MPDSPRNPHSQPQIDQDSNTQKRICDFCGESIALLYCRADSAKLCLSCDREVHSTNQLFTKHTRFQLCDGCDGSPASILCFTEHSVLCQNCDFELHSLPGSCSAHDRRPLEGFTGCPSVAELSAFVGFEGFDCKSLLDGDEKEKEGFGGCLFSALDVEEESDTFSDLLVWDTPTVFSIDELILSTDISHNLQAMVVPPLPKGRNLSCGRHKQEILCQLRELAKSGPTVKQDLDPLLRNQNISDETGKNSTEQQLFGACQPEKHATLQGQQARSFSCVNDTVDDLLSSVLLGSHHEGFQDSYRHSSMYCSANLSIDGLNSHDPVRSESFIHTPRNPTLEFSSADRDSAISRYKEKKRTRRYDKHIRYESRKVQAESRTRVKGRFAKDRQPVSSLLGSSGRNL